MLTYTDAHIYILNTISYTNWSLSTETRIYITHGFQRNIDIGNTRIWNLPLNKYLVFCSGYKLFSFKPSCYQHEWLVHIEILVSCAHISLNYKSEFPQKNTNLCN